MKNIFQINKNSFLVMLFLLIMAGACSKNEVWEEETLPETYLNMGYTEEIVAVNKENIYFRKENNILYYTLGVNRSGISIKGDVTVSLTVNNDTINNLIHEGRLSNTMVMPAQMYQIPEEVHLESGGRSAQFELAVDLNELAKTPDQTYAIAVELANPSMYRLKEDRKTTILTFNFIDLLSTPSFVDDLSSAAYTSTYATVSPDLAYEVEPRPSDRYNDPTLAKRSPGNATTSIIYSISKIQHAIPEANLLSGFKLKFLIPDNNPDNWVELEYRSTDIAEFVPISNASIIVTFIPELGQNSWRHLYIQGELPESTVELNIVIKGPPDANWIPLFCNVELFYEGGTPFVIDNEINF